ncbi:SIMPL domain-containing protein [Candidatus Gribaldobacteria bacterium]|nr:SIMPL domain-containing protein [Candidatus Gribaldobacteria bacterium]
METKQIDFSKRVFILSAIVVIGLIGLWTVQSISSLWGWIGGYGPREISVSSSGKATVTPDIALLKAGVTTEGNSVEKIVAENHTKMNNIIEAVKNSGVEEKDIQTTSYSLTPRYDWLETGRVFRGYTLNQEIAVKVRNFEKIGDVLELVTKNGGNVIGNLQFTIDDQEKIKAMALENAILNAKAKAKELAKASGLKLGKLINVYEDGVSPYYGYGMGGSSLDYKMESSVVPAPQIEAGEQEITVNVTLVYRVK